MKAEAVQLEGYVFGLSVREPRPAVPGSAPEPDYGLLATVADLVLERCKAKVLFVSIGKFELQHSHAVVAHTRFSEGAEIPARSYSSQLLLHLKQALLRRT